MCLMSKPLEELLESLSPDQRELVRSYVESLARTPRAAGRPRFTWAGAARDLRDQYTSVELQHQISRWRIGGS
jgi:hypothetical protein